MDNEIKTWLYDILQSINEIDSYFDGKQRVFEEYVSDIKTKRAIERDLEIMGEAANRVDEILINDFVKKGLSNETSSLLANGVLDFSYNYATTAIYNKYITDDKMLNENWSTNAALSALYTTGFNAGLNAVKFKASELKKQNDNNKKLKLNRYLDPVWTPNNQLNFYYRDNRPFVPSSTYVIPSRILNFKKND